MAEIRITGDIASALVTTGLEVGEVQTDFGPAVVRKAVLKGEVVMTITFPELQEKWVVITDGGIVGAKYTPIGVVMAASNTDRIKPIEKVKMIPKEIIVKKAKETGAIFAPPGTFLPIPLPNRLERKIVEVEAPVKPTLNNAEEATFTEVLEGVKEIDYLLPGKQYRQHLLKQGKGKGKGKGKVDKRKGPRPSAPRQERPRTKVAKDKKKGVLSEQEPTVRAYKGRPVDKKAHLKAVKGPGGHVKALRVPKQRPHAKSGPVPKVGAKEPIYCRQLAWGGRPEKIDTNLYSIKIVCLECGQPRYVDPKNAGITKHPVTRCKPCAKRHKSRVHDARRKVKLAAKVVESKVAPKKGKVVPKRSKGDD